MVTSTEENYLKAIYSLTFGREKNKLGTNELANHMTIAPATVSNMLKKLKEKKYINYQKYKGISLEKDGLSIATSIIRKHRLWETFLVEKMEFAWDEIHEVAEQLEHIKSEKLINQLDKLLGFPKLDPHGDPIPDVNGNIDELNARKLLADVDVKTDQEYKVVGVKSDSTDFLQYLDLIGLCMGCAFTIDDFNTFDHSYHIDVKEEKKVVTHKAASNIYVEEM